VVVPALRGAAVAATEAGAPMRPLPAPSPLVKTLRGTIALLPAYQALPAQADAPPAFTEVGFRYSKYSEDSIDAERVIFGSSQRYDIDISQFWLETPVGSNWAVALDIQNDYQTGASAWFVGAQANGEPGVIMSGASIQDNRLEVGVTTRYFWADGNAGFTVSHSDEDDYESVSAGVDFAWSNESKARTWNASVSTSNDRVSPTTGVIPVFIDREDLDTQSGYFGVTQILSRTAVLRVGLNYTYSEGFLSDPYKLNDERPSTHERTALSTGYRRFFIEADGSLQLDYRYYRDSWGTDSHTLELGWAQNLAHGMVTPYFRYYSQREADFYSAPADRSATYYSDDYRLSTYGAYTLGIKWAINVGDWVFELQGERYKSGGGWGLHSSEAAPALVDFWRGTIGIIWRFD
jgi:hypothetical protein